MDFLSEMCAKKTNECLTATYYVRQPVKQTDSGEKFTYEIVSPYSREYRTIIGNLTVEGRIAVIKTRSAINFKEKSYVVTQDGQFWQVTTVTINPQTEQSKQALRFFIDTAQTEKVISLIGKDNPLSLK